MYWRKEKRKKENFVHGRLFFLLGGGRVCVYHLPPPLLPLHPLPSVFFFFLISATMHPRSTPPPPSPHFLASFANTCVLCQLLFLNVLFLVLVLFAVSTPWPPPPFQTSQSIYSNIHTHTHTIMIYIGDQFIQINNNNNNCSIIIAEITNWRVKLILFLFFF